MDPTVASGALGQWFGEGDWQLVRRNQFTEVTGPGGIHGSSNPDTDPIWAMGWDARSLILALLENKTVALLSPAQGQPQLRRGPRLEHRVAAHPRDRRKRPAGHHARHLLAFPAGFSLQNSAGIAPRSNYLKVVGDFCRWNDRMVLGCDDSAKSEFLNTRPFKAKHASPKQSNSNLWFIDPGRLDRTRPARSDADPSGFAMMCGANRSAIRTYFPATTIANCTSVTARKRPLSSHSKSIVTARTKWQPLREITVPPAGAVSHVFNDEEAGAWIRLVSQQAASGVTANFQYRNRDERGEENDSQFAGIATVDKPAKTYGLMRSLAFDKLGLVAASNPDGEDASLLRVESEDGTCRGRGSAGGRGTSECGSSTR